MPTQEPTIPIPTPGDDIESVFTQQHVLNATYTAVKEEGTVPPCENSVVTVTSTYQMEYTLADGYDLSNIVTDNLEEGSIAHVGSDTYVWDGTQWVLQGGGGSAPLVLNSYSGPLSQTWQQIYDAMMSGRTVYIDGQNPNDMDYPNNPQLVTVLGIGFNGVGYLNDSGGNSWTANTKNDYPEMDE